MNIDQKVMQDLCFDQYMDHFTLPIPNEFNFVEIIKYLTRSIHECLHHVENGKVYKLLKIEQKLMIVGICGDDPTKLVVHIYSDHQPSNSVQKQVINYIQDWFDLHTDLKPFYQMAKRDHLLANLVDDYFGLRIVGIPDLFEALCWAIIGQQINLNFAYMLKKRLTENYGQHVKFRDQSYWLFPEPSIIAELTPEHLKKLQFTTKKAEYIINIAKAISSRQLSKKNLLDLNDFQTVENELLAIRGIGPWTAHYVMMRCLRYPNAFPIGDAGLHQAIKKLFGMSNKPSLAEIRQIFLN